MPFEGSQTDCHSFVFHKSCTLFERRASKLVSTVVSTFTAYYVHSWATFFPETPLTAPLPSFDGRAVCYPSVQNLRDYMSWRQVDCEHVASDRQAQRLTLTLGHINNLYNTTFWALIQLGGMDNRAAEQLLAVWRHSISADNIANIPREPCLGTRTRSSSPSSTSTTTTSPRSTRRVAQYSVM